MQGSRDNVRKNCNVEWGRVHEKRKEYGTAHQTCRGYETECMRHNIEIFTGERRTRNVNDVQNSIDEKCRVIKQSAREAYGVWDELHVRDVYVELCVELNAYMLWTK